MKEILKTLLTTVIIFTTGTVIMLWLKSSPVAGAHPTSSIRAPVIYSDPNLIEYWPTIDELQWFAETKRDGEFRKISQDAYEAKRAVWYGNKSAVKWHSVLEVK